MPGPGRFTMSASACRRRGKHIWLRYGFSGAGLKLPDPTGNPPTRRDELWKQTCCEIFIRAGDGYYELNFAPGGDWAAYHFTGYREGMTSPDITPPIAEAHRHGDVWLLQASLDLSLLPDLDDSLPWEIGLSAVIETKDGGISYWAVNHPPGKPDFHHPDSFALVVPPPEPA